MPTATSFDIKAKYIFLSVYLPTKKGIPKKFDAILDCGAPSTEFSDEALITAGYLNKAEQKSVSIEQGLQTQKYGKVVIPRIEICSHAIDNLEVYVSHFDKSWGIDALIGLDFFRRFRTTVDYKAGEILTEAL